MYAWEMEVKGIWGHPKLHRETEANQDYTDYTGKPHLKKFLGLGMVLRALTLNTQEADRYLWV